MEIHTSSGTKEGLNNLISRFVKAHNHMTKFISSVCNPNGTVATDWGKVIASAVIAMMIPHVHSRFHWACIQDRVVTMRHANPTETRLGAYTTGHEALCPFQARALEELIDGANISVGPTNYSVCNNPGLDTCAKAFVNEPLLTFDSTTIAIHIARTTVEQCARQAVQGINLEMIAILSNLSAEGEERRSKDQPTSLELVIIHTTISSPLILLIRSAAESSPPASEQWGASFRRVLPTRSSHFCRPGHQSVRTTLCEIQKFATNSSYPLTLAYKAKQHASRSASRATPCGTTSSCSCAILVTSGTELGRPCTA